MYMRLKKDLKLDFHDEAMVIDYQLSKFNVEFRKQKQDSETKRKNNIEEE